ncbi:cohesin subunit SA-3 isoform X2 [Danio rerio]|uniref:Cohesin subunit SA-3 isoform X2 n=6 Tax=Danio rerio TaxID=7955 RepID=A0AC58H919_DANRE|nr:cohesin subunit SA-2-like [Danio rerio]|eukprot:XP_009305909.3 cohesin subunit SA-2-like [Danio rerio]
MTEPYSSEDDSISLTGSDFEFQLKTSKRKVNSTQGVASPNRVHRRPASALSSSQSQAPTDSEGGVSTAYLYEAVRSGRSALTTVIDDWLEEYQRDKEAGLLELINFVVQCSGCKGVVSREMLSSLQNADIISHLTKEFNEDSVSYPLVSSGPQWRRFSEGVCEFVCVLVRGCRNTLLYDDFLFSSFIALLTGLADSQVRAFRHTSSFIAMRLMSSIVSVAADVNIQAQMIQRRSDLEKSKPAEERAIDRLEELEHSYRELMEQQEDLRSLMNGIFKGVFVHRYRDVIPEIRAVCMEEMGVWLRENPAHFLNDEHLKYVGWMLHDKQAAVRLQCVLTLQKLFEEKDFLSRLEFFTSRFKERILCMILDKDSDVAVETVKLLLLIQTQTDDGLSASERAAVYPLVFATHRGLACAAGRFLYHTLCCAADQSSDSRSVSILRLLALFFIQSEYHDHAAYLVDSLWDVAGAELKDWELMTSLLLQDSSLQEQLESALIDIMMCAVRQAAEATPPTARAHRKSVTARQKRVQAQDQRRISSVFMPVLPQLLAKFSADVGKVSRLLRAPLHFQLEVYGTSGRLEKSLDQLLSQVCDITLKHHEECVLEACVRVLCVLCSEGYTFCGRAETAVGQLLDTTVEKFTANLEEILQGSADEDDLYRAASSLNILAIFSSARDLTERNLFEFCFQLLKMGVETGEISEKLMVPALSCCAYQLLWSAHRNTQRRTDKAEARRVLKSLHSFCVLCQSCLSIALSPVRSKAFVCVCDLLLVFCRPPEGSISPLQRFSPDESLRAEMASFVLDYVFGDEDLTGEDEEMMTALLQKRNHLSGYCKLIIYGVLELQAATDILRYYHRFYKDFGDIIKETLNKSKMINSEDSARTVCLCLQQLYAGLDLQCCDGELMEIRLLAKKLAMNFSINLRLVRKPLLSLHQDGIRFASQGLEKGEAMNLQFLEILSEFSFKLLQPERKQLLMILRRVCSSVLNNSSVRMYERSLNSGSKETAKTSEAPVSKRRRTHSLETPAVISHTHHDTDDEFTDRPVHMKSVSRPQSSPLSQSLQSHLGTLSLGHGDGSDEDDDDIADYSDEDSETGITLPSTHGSTSFLEDLFV